MMFFEQSKLEPCKRIISRIENIEPFHQGFSELFMHDEIQQIVVILFKDKINFKMPGADRFKAHQDVQAGWDRVASGCNNEELIGKQWALLEKDGFDYIALPTEPGYTVFFDSYTPHRSKPNLTNDKRLSYPPDIERKANKEYVFRV